MASILNISGLNTAKNPSSTVSSVKLTYSDIQRWSIAILNKHCRDLNIDTSLPKSAKINAICHCCNVTTAGESNTLSLSTLPRTAESLTKTLILELQSLTPKILYSLTDWSSDIATIPAVDETDVKRYLLQTDTLTSECERTYKLSRPYQLKQFVHSVQICNVSSFCVIRARCLPSQSTNEDDVKLMHIVIDRITGQPYGGYCTCTVGYCQSCGHIGATLFCLSDWIASGISLAPDQPACTDVLCKWKDPRGAHVDPITMREMKLRKSDKRKSRANFSCPTPAPLNPDATSQLRFRLLNAAEDSGFEVPAVHALSADRFAVGDQCFASSFSVVSQLPDTVDELSHELLYCCEIEVSNYPLPVAFLPHKVFDSSNCFGFEEEKQRFIQSIFVSYTAADRRKMSEITKGQSSNLEWYSQRMGSLTASKFASVLRFMSSGRKKPDGLIREIQNYRQRAMRKVPVTNVASLRWGLRCESLALKSYHSAITSHHKDVTIQAIGLCVSDTDPYLRASPDGLVSCTCHPQQWIVEIKCPWTARNMDPADAINAGAIKYVCNDGGTFSLIPGAVRGYYEQVQGTMAVTGSAHCDFVIWTLRGMLILPVKFDSAFWEQSKAALQLFFRKYVVCEILTERIWRALPLFDDDSAEPDTSQYSMCDVEVAVDDDIVGDDVLQDDMAEEEFLVHACKTFESYNVDDYCEMDVTFLDASDFEAEETV